MTPGAGDATIRRKPASVLILGSGPVVIGQAAEFDYAGTQACRALRAEGVRTILVNSNPATIMTDPQVADAIYLEPLTVEAVEAVIAREKPEGLLAGLGGQTALNLTAALAEAGVFERHDIKLLGTPLEAIRMAEDREAFRDLLDRIGQPYAPSFIVEGATTIESPVWTPSGSTFSIEQTAMQVSSASRITSYSISCQPTRHFSTMTWPIGLARRPARIRSR